MAIKKVCDICGLEILSGAAYLQIMCTGTTYTNTDICYSCISTNNKDILHTEVIPRITNQLNETKFHWYTM